MIRFLSSDVGQIVARNGLLGILLAWFIYANDKMTERLFGVIERNTIAIEGLREDLKK